MDYSHIRAEARQRLAGRWALAVAVAAVAWLLGGLMTGSSFLPQFTYYIRGEDITLKDALNKACGVSVMFIAIAGAIAVGILMISTLVHLHTVWRSHHK